MVPRSISIRDEGTLPFLSLDSLDGRVPSDRELRPVQGPRLPYPPALPPFAAIDFETLYTTKYSLLVMTPWEYVADKRFNAYLVAIDIWDGRSWWRWVGHPSDAPWHLLPRRWVSHNAAFDELVYRRLLHDKVVSVAPPEEWNCTQDLAAYLQLDRGLDRCAPLLIGEFVDKSVRTKARAGGAGADELRDYAASDSRQCGWIWACHQHRWPEMERFLSRYQRRAGWKGIYADQSLMARAVQRMKAVQLEVAWQIPWANRHPVQSIKGVRLECARLGITPPPSLSLDEPEVEAWVQRHSSRAPWIPLIRKFAKAKQTQAHAEQMQARTRRDGTIPFELIYRKAPHTARWQSGGGLRIQNLDRDEFEGFHVRHFIAAPPGCKLLNADLSQIEPRVLNWLVGDRVFLDACRAGQSPYDAHAVSTMGYVPRLINGKPEKLKKANPGLYALAKARTLALGYQAGDERFIEMARTMAGLTVFKDEKSYCPDINAKDPQFFAAAQIRDRLERNDLEGWSVFPSAADSVRDYRAKARLIVNYWYACENEMRRDVGNDHVVLLPNGERITYYDVRQGAPTAEGRRGEMSAWVVKNSRNPKHNGKFYGGKLVENRVQRVAREVLADMKYRCIRQLSRFGFSLRWSTHDELNAYAPAAEAKHLLEAMLEIMHTPPAWALDLPVAAEGAVLDCYVK